MYGRGYQQPGMGFGPPVTPPIIKGLLIANGVVFLLQFLLRNQGVLVGGIPAPVVEAYGAVWPAMVWQGGYLWQPFTYMWLHSTDGIFHVGVNMFMLWMFGSQLALAWGPRRFLRYYLLCGVGAGVIISLYPFLLAAVGIPGSTMLRTLGASGAVYGVILAYSLTWPERTIMLIFPPVAFKAIWLIPITFGLNVLFGAGNVSHIGHLGGVIVGWLYLRRRGQAGAGNVLSTKQLRNRWRRYRMRQKLRAIRYEDYNDRDRRRDDERRLH